MAWSPVDILNPPPNGSTDTNVCFYLGDEDLFQQIYFTVNQEGFYNQIPLLSSYTYDLRAFGFAGPTVLQPVVGVPVTDCDASGCGTGGGGTPRPDSGFVYPRRVQ